jgi:hypothetical protein
MRRIRKRQFLVFIVDSTKEGRNKLHDEVHGVYYSSSHNLVVVKMQTFDQVKHRISRGEKPDRIVFFNDCPEECVNDLKNWLTYQAHQNITLRTFLPIGSLQ